MQNSKTLCSRFYAVFATRGILSVRSLQAFLASMLCLSLSAVGQAAPKAALWPRWQQHNPANPASLDFTFWHTFLATYVDTQHPSGIHRLRYASVSSADRQALQHYIAVLQTVSISTYNRQEQQAYWINLYNALTVSVVLAHWPVASIRDIRLSGLFSSGPWQAKLLTIEGEKVSLDDIEHRILRPIWQDNRLHYALNCASLGCPNLAPMAYTPASMEQLLEQGARAYINHPRGLSCQDGACTLSSIYVWFQEDFGGDSAGVRQHLLRYTGDLLAGQLQAYRGTFKHDYDWHLNAP